MDAPGNVSNGLGNVSITHNRFSADYVIVAPITIQEATKAKFGAGRTIKVEDNFIEVISVNSGAKGIHFNGTVETYSINKNVFDLVGNLNRPIFRFQCNLDGKVEDVKWSCTNNIFAMALANIHVFKGNKWWDIQKSKVNMENNVHHLKFKIPLDNKVLTE